MSKTIQKPRECRNAHCGAMCCPIQVEEMQTMWGGNPNKCPYYERRDDLYLTNAIPIPEGATNGDMMKIMFTHMDYQERNNVTLEIRGQTIEFTGMALREWWDAPYKKESEGK